MGVVGQLVAVGMDSNWVAGCCGGGGFLMGPWWWVVMCWWFVVSWWIVIVDRPVVCVVFLAKRKRDREENQIDCYLFKEEKQTNRKRVNEMRNKERILK